MRESNVRTISGTAKIIEGSRRIKMLLPRGTQLTIHYIPLELVETY